MTTEIKSFESKGKPRVIDLAMQPELRQHLIKQWVLVKSLYVCRRGDRDQQGTRALTLTIKTKLGTSEFYPLSILSMLKTRLLFKDNTDKDLPKNK
jgi:hypothetical protein